MTVNIQAIAFFLRSLTLTIFLALLAYFAVPYLATITPQPGQIEFSALVALSVALSSLLHWLWFRIGLRSTTLYVGNLAFKTTENELTELFSQFGPLNSVRIMKDRITRRPRGYAFVEMNSASAKAAINELHGRDFSGRILKVNVANKRSRQQD